MEPCDIINVRYFFGGEFLQVGPVLQYIGGDEAMSEIERDKLSLVELKAFLADHISVNDSMKFYFLIPGKELVNGLLFLCDDIACMKMSEYTTQGGVAKVFVGYHGEEDEQNSEKSDSDFEHKIVIEDAPQDSDASEPEVVLTADDCILVPNYTGAIKSVIRSPSTLNMHNNSTTTEHGQSLQGGYFQLAGLPCCHAITAIYKCGKVVEDFIHNCYSIEVFKKIYEHCLEPVEGEENWPVSANPRPQAPGYLRMPGRPKKNHRMREDGEAPKGKKLSKHGCKIKCGICGNTVHNKSGCNKNPEKGNKKNSHLQKARKKMKATEQSQTDAQVRASKAKSKGKEPAQSSLIKRKRGEDVNAVGKRQQKAKK